MSLINDALKRASQAQPPPVTSEPAAPLQPVLYAPPSKLPLVLLPILFLAVLALGVWFLLKGWEVAHQLYPTTPITVAAREIRSPATNPIAAAPASMDPAAPKGAVPEETVAPARAGKAIAPPETRGSNVVSGSPLLVAAPAPPPAANFPELKLQAIFYRPSRPEVVLNGKTLRVGDSISGAKVVSILPGKVALEWNGQTRELSAD